MNATPVPKRSIPMSAAEFEAIRAKTQKYVVPKMSFSKPNFDLNSRETDDNASKRNPWKARHKFNAVRTERDGIKFPSKSEAAYYDYLQACRKAGSLAFFLRQVPLHIPGAVLRLDFLEFWADGTITFTDVKGMETDEFKHKRRAIEILYPFKIRTARQRGRGALRAWEYA